MTTSGIADMTFWTRRFASMDTLWWSYCSPVHKHRHQGSECAITSLTFQRVLWVSPPSPAGRCCKRLPDQQPAGWGQFQNVTLAPAHLRSAAAPNVPGAGVARKGRLHLYTRALAGQWEGVDQAEWSKRVQHYFGGESGLVFTAPNR